MSESAQLLEAVEQIREYVRLMAEPAIAERDAKRRAELKRIVGSSLQKGQAILRMNGTHERKDIQRETGISKGNLSTLVKVLKESDLISGDGKQPKLAISVPPNFFER
jgi:CRP-like cAMP-binding protein